MPIYYQWIYFLSPFSYAFGAIVVDQFEQTPQEFAIALSGVVLRNEWLSLLVVLAFGIVWRLLGLLAIIRLFRKNRPGNKKLNDAPLSSYDFQMTKIKNTMKLDV